MVIIFLFDCSSWNDRTVSVHTLTCAIPPTYLHCKATCMCGKPVSILAESVEYTTCRYACEGLEGVCDLYYIERFTLVRLARGSDSRRSVHT